MFEQQTFYHYTNNAGAEAIMEHKKILSSIEGSGDALCGSEVYFSSLPPHGKI